MLKTLMLGLALLTSTAWLVAQESPQTGSSQSGSSMSGQSGSTMNGQNGSSMAGQTTVQGCLQASNGGFTLTSDSGTMYQLQGDTSKLSKHNGHEVEITGSTSGAGSSTSAMGSNSSTAGAGQTLTVSSMKHISKTCSNMKK